jgi:hypothetical protein
MYEIYINNYTIVCEDTDFLYTSDIIVQNVFLPKMLKKLVFRRIITEILFANILLWKEVNAQKTNKYFCTKFQDCILHICLDRITIVETGFITFLLSWHIT